jgi:uncharacterized protein (TIGR02246 family)
MSVADQGAKAITGALEAAWNAHDAAAFASVFRADARFTNVFGIELQGREAIERGHAQILTGMFRDSTLRLDPPSVLPLGPGLAWAAARWRMDGAYDPQGAPWPNRRGIMHFVSADDDGAWRIAAFTNMDLPPDETIDAERQKLVSGPQS